MNETFAVNVDQNTPVNVGVFQATCPLLLAVRFRQRSEHQFQMYQDLNYLTGHHQIRFGGQFFNIQRTERFGAFLNSVQRSAKHVAGLIQPGGRATSEV